MRKKKSYRRKMRIASALMGAAMLMAMLGGCGKPDGAENTDAANTAGQPVSAGSDADTQGQDTDSDGSKAMGRYVENVTEMSDLAGYGNKIYGLADGSIVITDMSYHPFHISKDKGQTFEDDTWEWHKKLMDNEYYVADSAIGSDGTAAVIYDASGEGEYEPTLLVVKPDGTEIPIETPKDANYPFDAAVSDDGRVFVSCLGSDALYEANDDGSCTLFLEGLKSRPQQLQSRGSLLVVDGYDYGAPLIYDLEKNEYIEDEVLKDFCSENYGSGDAYSSDFYSICYFLGEEGVLYIAGEKGVHRHVIGGSAVEQIIDGRLSTFGNPQYGIGGMIMLPDNEFMTIFSGGRLVHYVYDKDTPTVPDDRLQVYSLKDDDAIRQAISLYQSGNPDVFIEYEVGMEEGSSVARDDAIKNLNTKIMAGEGPDVLILDNMPLDSYIEKGLLMDMAPLIDSLSGDEELFGNIVEAMKTDGKLYAMPCGIQVPVLLGEEKYVSMGKDLKGLADMMEALKRDNPGEILMNICSERGIMRYFSMVSVPAWTDADGEMDKAAVREFLEATKRIYDAEVEGVPAEHIEQYVQSYESYREEFGISLIDSKYFRTNVGGLLYAAGYKKIIAGALDGRNDYSNMISVNKVSGFEDRVWTLMNGQCRNVFCAQTLMGINAASNNTSLAEDFIKLCLGKENQKSMMDSLMVNKAAFDECFAIDTEIVDETGVYIREASSSQGGERFDYDIYWPDEKQTAELKSSIESLDTPYLENMVFENVVFDEGVPYFRGEQSLDEAVSAIEKKMALYLAE